MALEYDMSCNEFLGTVVRDCSLLQGKYSWMRSNFDLIKNFLPMNFTKNKGLLCKASSQQHTSRITVFQCSKASYTIKEKSQHHTDTIITLHVFKSHEKVMFATRHTCPPTRQFFDLLQCPSKWGWGVFQGCINMHQVSF